MIFAKNALYIPPLTPHSYRLRAGPMQLEMVTLQMDYGSVRGLPETHVFRKAANRTVIQLQRRHLQLQLVRLPGLDFPGSLCQQYLKREEERAGN